MLDPTQLLSLGLGAGCNAITNGPWCNGKSNAACLLTYLIIPNTSGDLYCGSDNRCGGANAMCQDSTRVGELCLSGMFMDRIHWYELA